MLKSYRMESSSPLDRPYELPGEWPPDPEDWPAPFALEALGSARRVDTGDMVVIWDETGYVAEIHAGGGWQMPRSYQALVNRPGLPLCQLAIEATSTGPVCRHLTLVGAPLTAAGIRVPLRELVTEATSLVGARDDSSHPEPEPFMRALGEEVARPEPGKRLSDEWLKRVAAVYRDALSRGLPATDTVAEAFPISRSTAGRWVVEARRRGLLGPAVPGRAGEEEPRNRKEK
jgi:hypothetical protein